MQNSVMQDDGTLDLRTRTALIDNLPSFSIEICLIEDGLDEQGRKDLETLASTTANEAIQIALLRFHVNSRRPSARDIVRIL